MRSIGSGRREENMKRSSGYQQGVLLTGAKIRFIKAGLLVAACIGLVACTTESGLGPDALKELQEGQKTILERLGKIEKTQQQILAARGKRAPKRPTIDYSKVYDIKIGKSPVRGAKDAKATIIEFSDFQCPYSLRVQPLIETLLKAYPDDLQHVYKNFPLNFHKQAMPAAKACIAAGLQGKFWEMQEVIFKNTKKLQDADLKKYAQEVGLDVEQFEKDYKSEEVNKIVQQDLADAKKAQVRGTPTLFLNGKRVQDRSEAGMKKQIQAILEGKKKS
jgi:protein-disulfide isomerase